MPKNKGKVSQAHRCPATLPRHRSNFALSHTDHSTQGGKNRRRGKNENDNEKRELTFKEEGQEYAQVLKMLGTSGPLESSPWC